MSFRVTVRTDQARFHYFAIALESGAVIAAAYDYFGVCGVTVMPLRGGQ